MSTAPAPSSMTRQEIESLIVARAWKDASFKKEFINDPKGTIQKYSGQSLPGNVNIIAHEEDANTMHITIPQPPRNVDELSDQDLERVAGGTDVVITAAIISAVSAVVGASISVANDQTRARAGW